ncbi:putative heat shock protein HtpX [Bacteriovorax sp. BSW11_IV]|uniref:protease HtpX n=1 Tax=Bacteriovorax sp. BSW11_IV TaxID=1353529 RepID=UPI00038A3D8B|nr:protease HtpX [Bacteriovorax sp. BSW11_IV]EQC49486.1 putative heat shock protein HtpX [Bacteriovorax sp. BSW11_IV]
MFKRIGLFLLTNILMVATIGIVLNLLGVNGYLTAQGINYQSLLIICLVWGMGGSFISLMLSKFMVKMTMGVQIQNENGPYGDLVRKVHVIARRAGITKMPEVGVYDSPEVNAFATGPSANSSLIAVSTGLLREMNEDEVEGVLAHEVAHAANGDMVTLALVQGVVNAFVMFISRIAAFAISNALRSNDDEDRGPSPMINYMIVMVLDIVLGLLAMPIVMWFSRFREYRADSGGASYVGKDKMIRALESLKGQQDRILSGADNMATMKISGKVNFAEMFSTHPTLDKRIQALRTSR